MARRTEPRIHCEAGVGSNRDRANVPPMAQAPITPEWAALQDVAQILDDLAIEYMLTGSMALNLYAVPRMTRDLDLVVELSSSNVAPFKARLGDAYYADERMMLDAITHQFMFNIIRYDPMVKLDFVIRKDEPYRREEFSRRRRVELFGYSIRVVAPEDLVLSKLYWAKDSRSEIQLRDVRSILSTVPGLDWDYLQRWSLTLDVHHLLEEVRR